MKCGPSVQDRAQVAQLVEQWTENPRVGCSSQPLGTIFSMSYDVTVHPADAGMCKSCVTETKISAELVVSMALTAPTRLQPILEWPAPQR